MKILKKVVVEMIPVILGILIALLINNWNEEMKDTRYLDKMFLSMKEELRESNESISRVIPKQQNLIDSIDYYLKDENTSLLEIVGRAGGFQSPTVKINSWRAIASSKIELIDYERVSVLSDIEDGKRTLDLKLNKMMDFVYQNLKETNEDKKEVLRIFVLDVVDSETYLQNSINKLIDQ